MKTSNLAVPANGTRRPARLLIQNLVQQAILLIGRVGNDDGYVRIPTNSPAGAFVGFLMLVIYVLWRAHVIK